MSATDKGVICMTKRFTWLSVALAAVVTGALLFPPASVRAIAVAKGSPSGGRTVAHHAEGEIIKGAAARRSPMAKYINVGHDAVEPSLGITKNGDVFYTAAGSRNEVLRSKDGGKTWNV